MSFSFWSQIILSSRILSGSIKICFLVLLICFASACSHIPAELKGVDELIETKPDSALFVLQKIPKTVLVSESNRALYGLLLFSTLDKLDRPLKPKSLLNFSFNYYQRIKDKRALASCYYLKARICSNSQEFEAASLLYIKALDSLDDIKDYNLLGHIYSELGYIYSMQQDFKSALIQFQSAANSFKQANKPIELSLKYVEIGRCYRMFNKYKIAHKYYFLALNLAKDSIVSGAAFQEIGYNYYCQKQYDSAQYYLAKSLYYPYKGTNYSIRNYFLADLSFDIAKYDLAYKYALSSLKYPANFYTRRECYRILANTMYLKGNLKQMAVYMTDFQSFSDSVRIIESQTKLMVLKNLHNTVQENRGSKRNMIWIISIMFLLLILLTIILYLLYKRNKHKKSQITIYRKELIEKKIFVSQLLLTKMSDLRDSQKDLRKKATASERKTFDKELYNKCLHLDNWDAFSCEMNHAFNQIVDVLQHNYEGITQKEIIWCCLNLLDIPNEDKALLLDASAQSLYKLKQRLAQKLNLQSTKDIDSFLLDLSVQIS